MNDRELSCHIIRPHQTVVCLSHILIFPSSFSSFTFPFLWAQALPPPEQTQSYTTECLVISSSCWFLTAKLCSGQSLFLLLVDGASLSLSWWSIYFKKKKRRKTSFFRGLFVLFSLHFFALKSIIRSGSGHVTILLTFTVFLGFWTFVIFQCFRYSNW